MSISACGTGATSTSFVLNQEIVDPRFREFYEWMGSEQVLGPAISPKFSHEGTEYQYTSTVLLVFSPRAVSNQRFQFAALGVDLGVAEPPMNPDAPNGHNIYSGFMAKYNQMGGARYIGLPITEVRFNHELKRVEQYFENAGFYHLEDATGEVFLIHYGSWKCAEACGFDSPDISQVGTISNSDSPFATAVSRLDPGFTGYPLTEPYVAFDGMLEQIFENVVIVADPNNPGGIRLRPILGMLGVSVSNNNHDVPQIFRNYLSRNTGQDLSGPPISAYADLSSDVDRQCFENLCLDYHSNAPDDLRVRPAPLGYSYKNMFYQRTDGSRAQNEISMRVWEAHPILAQGQAQVIGVKISATNTPLKNFEPVLTLVVPDVGEIPYNFPPTNEEGITSVKLQPIDIPNGTRVEYQVCVMNMDERFCSVDDFLVWEPTE